ncbi:MAG: DUF4143 domain-containing protein [Endomicrobium sp.]|nr:DUF4143 domain-containing protein [Endomicrobium sp.]
MRYLACDYKELTFCTDRKPNNLPANAPYFKNTTKRAVKTPKIYFADTGLLIHLLRYKDVETLFASAVLGNVF